MTMAKAPTQKSMGVACLAPSPKLFGGYDLDWEDVECELARMANRCVRCGLTHLWSTLDQGPEMIWTEEALQIRDAIPRVMLASRSQGRAWAALTGHENRFDADHWRDLLSGLDVVERRERCHVINAVAAGYAPGVWQTANERCTDHASVIVLVWPEEAGEWTESADSKARAVRRSMRKGAPVWYVGTKTEADAKGRGHVRVAESRILY